MTTSEQKPVGRGGRRVGAGRPSINNSRLSLDADHGAMLRDIVRVWRQREPQCHWTARHVVQQLILLAALQERDAHATDSFD